MAYLKCSCGSGEFSNVVKLRTSQAGGVVQEVAGHQCAKCQSPADVGQMVRQLDLQKKAEELKTLTEELAEDAKNARPKERQTA